VDLVVSEMGLDLGIQGWSGGQLVNNKFARGAQVAPSASAALLEE